MDHNDLFISSFYGLPQEVIQEISQKPLEAQCIFTQQPDFEDEEQFVSASNIVLLQIRGNYVVQCQPRSKRIAGGMFLCLDNKFEVKRRSDDLEADVGEPYAICFQIPSKFDESDHIELKFGVKRAKWRELEKFVQCLEKKNIFQTNIYNDYNNSDRIFYSSTACLYEAVNKKSGKLCVIKQIKKQLFQQSGRNIKMAIEREFSIPYSFNHPNICKYFGVFDYNQSIYIVMERLQGNLLHFLHSPFIKIEIEIKLIFKKICQAVKILHDHYVMHRDLKPQNIAMRRVNQFIYDPVLIDFGLAQFEDKLPFVFTQCGTPGYIAPEIVRNRTPNIVYDRKCDIFSLGCIFHLMWLGKAPFDSQNFPQVKDVKQVIKRNVQCFVDRNNNKYQRLAPEIKQLLFWMLEIDPKKRPTIDQVLSHKFFDVLKTVQQTDILRDKQKLFQLAMSKKIVSQSQGCREGSKQITKEKTEKQKQKEKQMELQVNKEQGYNQNEVKQKKQENNKVLIHQCAEEIPKANDGTPELSIEGHSLRQ